MVGKFVIKSPGQEKTMSSGSTVKGNSSACAAAVLVFLLLLSLLTTRTQAVVVCQDDTTCIEKLRPGSSCVDGVCSNPFQSGCLYNYNMTNKLRACNSDDSPSSLLCQTNDAFQYPEIRISSQDWTSALFGAWVYQLFLSEVLQVPVTIETSAPDRRASFYDPLNAMDYGAVSYDYEALRNSLQAGGDCTKVKANNLQRDDSQYKSCAHVIPEVWNGQRQNWRQVEADGLIEPPAGSGVVGKLGWFIPLYTAKNDSTLLEYLGYAGPQNRKKIADAFKRPFTWKDYCDSISPNRCAVDDGIASRPPMSQEEEGLYFAGDGLYIGHFNATEENDCEKYPSNCTGHIADVPCYWSTFATSQAYHNGVPVKSNGPMEPNGGYSYSDLIAIYLAANATRSNVLVYWWYPEELYQQFLGTDAEMMTVQFPPPSQDCLAARVSPEDRCSADITLQRGEVTGSCETEAHSILKLIVSNLLPDTFSVPKQFRSPAYEAIKGLFITELHIGQMMNYWFARNVDKWNYDPRDAVCQWFVEIYDELQIFVPRSYPRVLVEKKDGALWTAVLVLGVLGSFLVLVTATCVYRLRTVPVMRASQLDFLYMLLAGLLMVSIGAAVSYSSPNLASCVAVEWLIVLGYTLELVPLIIKMAAINRIMQASENLRRIRVSKRSLYISVAIVMSIAGTFLAIWTAIDPPLRQRELELTNDTTDDGETIVTAEYFCSSDSDAWDYAAVVWQCILLVSGSVMAFQSRKVRQDFNESQILGVLIYSQFLFAVARLATFSLDIGKRTAEGLLRILVAIDAIISLTIYFFPKIIKAVSPGDETRSIMAWMPRDGHVSFFESSRRSRRESASRNRWEGPMSGSSDSDGSDNDKVDKDTDEVTSRSGSTYRSRHRASNSNDTSAAPEGDSVSPDGLPLEDEENLVSVVD